MFGNLFLGELKKILRPKTLIILAVVFVIFFVMFAVMYNVNIEEAIRSALEQSEGVELEEYMDILYNNNDIFKQTTPENIDVYIETYQQAYNESVKSGLDTDFYHKGMVTMLKYIKDNGLYGQDLKIAGYNEFESIFETSAESFATTYFSTVVTILTIFALVSMVGLYGDEYNSGTIKLVMMRPITRNRLTFAKLLAMYTVLITLLGASTLISYLYGLAAFGGAPKSQVLVLFNAVKVLKMSFSGYIFFTMVLSAISLLTTALLAFTLGTAIRKKTPAILLGLAVGLGIIASVLSFMGIERFLFSTNLNLSIYFGLSAGVPYKGNFFIGLPMLIVYSAVLYFALFFVANKRDLA